MNQETLSIAWCDNGLVDGSFMEGLMDTVIRLKNVLPIDGFSRVQGIQIARQRQLVVDFWLKSNTDWMLWVDSDVVVTPNLLMNLWNHAHTQRLSLISGLYFTLWSTNPLENPKPVPSMYRKTEEGGRPIRDFPLNTLIKVDYTGLGFILLHRSVVEKLSTTISDGLFFVEEHYKDGKFIGEDVSFCNNLTKAGIPIIVDTGSIADHVKRVSINGSYYKVNK